MRLRSKSILLALAGLVALLPNAHALVGSNSGTNIFNGLYINDHVGAGTFYSMGFGGTQAIVANIEAGTIWNGHESLGNVTTFISDPTITGTSLGQTDWHATAVGQAIAGRGLYTYQDGIAPFATVWSGAVATAWNGAPGQQYTGSFSTTDQSFAYAYTKALATGINGQKANIVNSSWGFTDPTGSNPYTVFVDSLLRANNALGVFAAGNEGPSANSVGGMASGFNGISVAALTGDTATPAYSSPADFSSRGPGAFYNPSTNATISGVRPVVHIAAPGDDLTMAFYGGLTGGHVSGTDPTGGSGAYYAQNLGGTSFAAPIVAGAAALMVDAGKAFGVADMANPLVVKAALMAGAKATTGWNNGQQNVGGVITTTQALDAATGAGALNLDTTYKLFIGDPVRDSFFGTIGGINATLGILGSGGGSVLERGWDLGLVTSSSPNDYAISQQLSSGNELSIALTWFAGRYGSLLSEAEDRELANLSLELWKMSPTPSPAMLIARSDAAASTVEFLRVVIPEDGFYTMRVVWNGFNYNLGSAAPEATYGLAWTKSIVPTPEPGAFLFLTLLAAAALLRQRLRGTRGSTLR